MAGLLIRNARLILDGRIAPGSVLIDGNKIESIFSESGENCPVHPERMVDLGGMYLSPGFIETHVHGGGMCDFSDGRREDYVTAVRTHLEHGATTICPTLIATSREEIERSISAFKGLTGIIGAEACLPGLHLEGPYLSRAQKGALPENFIRDPDPAEYEELVAMSEGTIRRWTLAPERDGAMKFIEYLVSKDILPSIGHTDAEYEDVLEAYRRGCRLITHLYSAMSTIVRRGGFRFPGVIESAFCIEGMTSEIISDGAHVPPVLLNMVWRLLGSGHVILTTDASRCAGTDAKEAVIGSMENGIPIIVEDGVAKLPDRSAFGGSIATAERLVRVLWKEAGVPLPEAVKMYTATPAHLLGMDDRKGMLKEGFDADLVCFDDELNIKGVMTSGFRSGAFREV